MWVPRNNQLVNFNVLLFCTTSIPLYLSLLCSDPLCLVCPVPFFSLSAYCRKDSIMQSLPSKSECQWSSTAWDWHHSFTHQTFTEPYSASCFVLGVGATKRNRKVSYPEASHSLTWNLSSDNNDSKNTLNACYVLVCSSLCSKHFIFLLTHLSLIISLWGGCYHSYFIDEETGVQLPSIT